MTTNHPANGPVSLERLRQIHGILSKASAQSDGGNLGYAMADAVKVIDEVLKRYEADSTLVVINDDVALAACRAISDDSVGSDDYTLHLRMLPTR